MAKEIKAIECPKCGSADKVELKPDYFRCLNCNTEYYLDDDDITINHNVRYTNPTPTAPPPNKKVTLVVVAIALIMVMFIMLRIVFSDRPISTVSNALNFRWWDSDEEMYVGANQQPILVIMGQRDYSGRDNNKGKYVAFYDLLTDKELKMQRITSIPESKSEDVKFKSFANGDIYAIVNKSLVFKINKTTMTADDVTKSLLQSHAEMVSGIANAEFMYDNYGDGFNVLTNDGKSYHYFPIINKVYTKEQLSEAQKALHVKDPGAKTKTYFAFSYKSNDFPDEKLQLIKFIQKDNMGGPNDHPRFEWRGNTNYKTNVTTKSLLYWDADLVSSYNDLTPGRLYFDPKVLYSDNDYVLINFNATAAESSPTSIQCINATTGAIVFTTPFTENMYFYYGIRYKNGFIVKSNTSILLIGMDGKIIKDRKTQ